MEAVAVGSGSRFVYFKGIGDKPHKPKLLFSIALFDLCTHSNLFSLNLSTPCFSMAPE